MIDKERLERIRKAVDMQSKDATLWDYGSIHEAYIIQSLRWLHCVIEDEGAGVAALKAIEGQMLDHEL